MSTTVEIGGNVYVSVSAGPMVNGKRTARLDVWIGSGGSTALLPPAQAIEVGRALLRTAGADPAEGPGEP